MQCAKFPNISVIEFFEYIAILYPQTYFFDIEKNFFSCCLTDTFEKVVCFWQIDYFYFHVQFKFEFAKI